jgi:hypothetical protein
MQSILIYVIFGLAVVFIGRKVYQSFTHKEGGGCAHCDPADPVKLKKEKPVSGK